MWALACLACAIFCTASSDTDGFQDLLANISLSKHQPSPAAASAPGGQPAVVRSPAGQPTTPGFTETPSAPDSTTGTTFIYNIRELFFILSTNSFDPLLLRQYYIIVTFES